MLKLRKILLSSLPFSLILIIALLLTAIRLVLLKDSSLTGEEKEIVGILDHYKIKEDMLFLEIKYKHEKVRANYYFKTKEEQINFQKTVTLGETIKLTGILTKPNHARIENGFSYAAYLKTQKTYYLMQIEKLERMSNEISMYYRIKNKIEKRMQKAKKSRVYLQTFVLGEDDNIKEEVKESFRLNGISHLFAISGMHISLLSSVFLYLLKKIKIKEKKRYFIVSLLLISYLLYTFSPSVLRATLFFLLFSLNKIYYFHIKPFHLFLLTFSICILINPYFIKMIGFQYSFLISGSLILGKNYINKGKHYFERLWKTSELSFFASILVSLPRFYEINILSILYNLFFVPFISYLIFPLSLFCFICPILDFILYPLLQLLEKISLFLGQISYLKITVGKPSPFIFFLYIVIFVIYLLQIQKRAKSYWFLFLFPILIQIVVPYFSKENYLMMLDVGQGDSILIKSNNKAMLIDTGGIKNFKKEGFKEREQASIVKNITVPYLKSKGIKKLDKLILTHGDYDHLGEAEILLKEIKVEEVYINSNKMNNLEEKLARKKELKKLTKDITFTLGEFSFYSLNDSFKEENDSSIVLLGLIKNKKILLMGDASCKTENKILSEYKLGKVDLLKVGHHGSKTSSCKEFLTEISPEIALISAGKNNKFHHPHPLVVERFSKLKIKYLVTSEKGSIKISFS